MGKVSSESKQHWNETHYTQVKVSVDPVIASAFKQSCLDAGISMASTLSAFMAESAGIGREAAAAHSVKTRKQRRRAVAILIKQLEDILDGEETFRDNIPENLTGSPMHEDADGCIVAIEEAIAILHDAY